jgi:hypothetical protein
MGSVLLWAFENLVAVILPLGLFFFSKRVCNLKGKRYTGKTICDEDDV